jgi:hypothetical protein
VIGPLLVLLVFVIVMKKLQAPSGGNTSAPVGGARVLGRENAAGVLPEMLALLDAWELEGDFDVTLPSWPPAGTRTDSQELELHNEGLTNATTARNSAHGHAAALDVWMVDFDPHKSFDEQPEVWARQQRFGEWAESKGFRWGFRWANQYGFGPYGDAVHFELANWTSFPFVGGVS